MRPASMSNDTLSRAMMPPKRTVTLRTLTIGVDPGAAIEPGVPYWPRTTPVKNARRRGTVYAASIGSHTSGGGRAMATIQGYCAPGVYDPPTYTQGIKVTGAQTILFLSGQVAYDKDGGVLHRGDFKAQAREAYRALRALVEAAGGTMDSFVKLNTYLTDIRYRADLVPVRQEFFAKRAPASTLVQVSALAHPDWLIEIEGIAVL